MTERIAFVDAELIPKYASGISHAEHYLIYDFETILWGAWWFTTHQHLLTPVEQHVRRELLGAIFETMPGLLPENAVELNFAKALQPSHHLDREREA